MVQNILFLSAQPYMPQMFGGMQSTTHALTQALRQRGYNATILASLMLSGWLGWRGRFLLKALRKKAVLDQFESYPVYRAWKPWEAVSEIVPKVKPDVAVVSVKNPVKIAHALQKNEVPILLDLKDVEFKTLGGDLSELSHLNAVANSQFTADKYRDAFGLDPKVIHPLVDKDRYRVVSARKYVTFINTNPVKGLDIALEVARLCPEIAFEFVETWPLKPEELTALTLGLATLPNVIFTRVQKDVRVVYRRSRLVLAPSQWEEAFGRVGLEPQISGIPVIASKIGGLPEAVGSGGVLIDPNAPAEVWANEIKGLCEDQARYEALSQKSIAHSKSQAFENDHQIGLWLDMIARTARSNRI